MSGAVWGQVAQAALQVADSWMQSSSAHKANRTNIQLQREQQKWEEEMSNTAIQRRAADFEKAGFNRLLAATGPGASTPSISPAQVDSEYKGGTADKLIAGYMMQAQLQNLRANTAVQAATARKTLVDAKNAETYGEKTAEANFNVALEKSEQADLETARKRLDNELTAAQIAKLNATWPEMLKLIEQQIKEKKLDVEALENISNIGGAQLRPLIQTILTIIGKRGR